MQKAKIRSPTALTRDSWVGRIARECILDEDEDEDDVDWLSWVTDDNPLCRITGEINYLLKENNNSHNCINDKLIAKWYREVNSLYCIDIREIKDLVTTIRIARLERERDNRDRSRTRNLH